MIIVFEANFCYRSPFSWMLLFYPEQNPPPSKPKTGETNRKPVAWSHRLAGSTWRHTSSLSWNRFTITSTKSSPFPTTTGDTRVDQRQSGCDQERSRMYRVCSTLSFSAAEASDSVSFDDHDLAFSEQQVSILNFILLLWHLAWIFVIFSTVKK